MEWIRTEERLPERQGVYEVKQRFFTTGQTKETSAEFWPRIGRKTNVWKNAAGMVLTTVTHWREGSE